MLFTLTTNGLFYSHNTTGGPDVTLSGDKAISLWDNEASTDFTCNSSIHGDDIPTEISTHHLILIIVGACCSNIPLALGAWSANIDSLPFPFPFYT